MPCHASIAYCLGMENFAFMFLSAPFYPCLLLFTLLTSKQDRAYKCLVDLDLYANVSEEPTTYMFRVEKEKFILFSSFLSPVLFPFFSFSLLFYPSCSILLPP